MDILIIACSSFIVALSGALVPGPLLAITVAESARRGFIAGPLLMTGHSILELLMVSILLFGMAPFLNAPLARFLVSLIGGLVLFYMGCKMIKDSKKFSLSSGHLPPQVKTVGPVMSGIVGSASNPYWSIWWFTVGPTYLLASKKLGNPGILAFYIGHIMADFAWYSFVSLAVSKGKTIMGEKGFRLLLRSCAVFLLFFGLWFVSRSLVTL